MSSYQVMCTKCKGERRICIYKTAVGSRVDWLEQQAPTPSNIVSARQRLDNEWGFQCICGNNDLMTVQEKRTFENPAAPKPQEINDIVKNLKADKPKFELRAV